MEGKWLFPLVMGGEGRTFCEPTICGGTLFPGKIRDGRLEGLAAACVGVNGPLAGVLGDGGSGATGGGLGSCPGVPLLPG